LILNRLNLNTCIVINNAKAGTFDFAGGQQTMFYQTNTSASNSVTYLESSGTVTITSLTSTTVSGTFSFTSTNSNSSNTTATHVITEGQFTCAIVNK
jgi:hypothetical protein